jgi:hypothetical protein
MDLISIKQNKQTTIKVVIMAVRVLLQFGWRW